MQIISIIIININIIIIISSIIINSMSPPGDIDTAVKFTTCLQLLLPDYLPNWIATPGLPGWHGFQGWKLLLPNWVFNSVHIRVWMLIE